MQSTVTILSVSILSTEWPYNYSIALSLNNGHSQLCVVLKTIFYLLAKQLIESIFLCGPTCSYYQTKSDTSFKIHHKIRCETINLMLQVLFAVEQQLSSYQEEKEKNKRWEKNNGNF